LWVAAAILLLLATSVYTYYRHTLGDRLFQAYFTQNPLYLSNTVRGATLGKNSETQPLPTEALAWYRLGEYDKSYASLSHHLEKHPDDGRAKIMVALAAMSMDQLAEADLLLAEVVSTQDTLQVNEARWYLALSALRQHKIKEAREMLEQLTRDDAAEYQSIAQEVLQKLPKS
jgi:tetratricopeptide (TPR) repeat protein